MQGDKSNSAANVPLLAHRYVWQQQLPRGGSALVHLGWDRVLERPVVVKLFGPSFVAACGGQEGFAARAAEIENLEHPRIAALLDYGAVGGNQFAVYEHIPGGNLAERVAAGELGPASAARVVRQLARALTAAHRSGVVHGHLTPSKVLFDAKDKVVLGGFAWGGETVAGRQAQDGFASPRRKGGAAATTGDDVYSLAAVGLFLLTGEAPGPEGDIARSVLRLPAGSQLFEVLTRALSRDPRDRYPTASAFAEAFELACAGSASMWAAPATEPSHSSPTPARKPRRKSRWVSTRRVAAAGLGAMAILVMSSVLLGSDESERPPTAISAGTGAVSESGGGVTSVWSPTAERTATGQPSTATSEATEQVAGTRGASPEARVAPVESNVCADGGWQAFSAAGGAHLFPSENACRILFESDACPSPPVIDRAQSDTVAGPGRTVAWHEACGATEYWVEVTGPGGLLSQQKVDIGAANRVALDLPSDHNEPVAVTITAFYLDPDIEWSHTLQFPR